MGARLRGRARPEDADPRLDYGLGALLVPIERWNEHAELEPNLAPCSTPADRADGRCAAELGRWVPQTVAPQVGRAVRLAGVASRIVLGSIAALAIAYIAAVLVWLWSLRAGISGPRLSTGLVLVGAAVLLAWLTGIAGGEARGATALLPTQPRVGPRRSVVVARVTHHPLETLRLGLTIQLAGFAVLLMTH